MGQNSTDVDNWLSEITGIPLMLPDPHLFGGGLHVSGPGGTLTPHTDFHVVNGLSLFRRINLLFYLNRDRQAANGGGLELWDIRKDRIVEAVLPVLGRCVIFRTDNVSMHGCMTPVAGANRQSLALYYYTAEDAETFAGDGATNWRFKSAARDNNTRLQLGAQGALTQGSDKYDGPGVVV